MRPRVIALIPAHNEQDGIAEAVRCVRDQVDRVIVLDDRSRDRTAAAAAGAGAQVLRITANEHKKAGALNQALARILRSLADEDFVLVQDADSFLAPDFVANAKAHAARRGLGAVGGLFLGRDGGGLVGWSQRNEYERFRRDTARNGGKTLCLTGTATLFRVDCLRAIAASRDDGQVYDTSVLTEDFELTLRLRSLGYEAMAPADCSLTTEVMETWTDLRKQRLRWKRGAIESLARYGFGRLTAGQWARQGWSWLGFFATILFLGSAIYAAFAGYHFRLFWLGLTAVFALERAVTVRGRGWRTALAAATLLPEMAYDLTLQSVHAKAWGAVILRRRRDW